jgi:hypothetical protein
VRFAIGAWPRHAAGLDERDLVRATKKGHLVLRIAGASLGTPEPIDVEELANLDLSVLVQDGLREDVAFEAELVDAE